MDGLVHAVAGQAYQEGARQAMGQAEQLLQQQVQAAQQAAQQQVQAAQQQVQAAQQQMAAMQQQHQDTTKRFDDLWQDRLRQQAAEDEGRLRKLSEENARLQRRNSDLQAETCTAKEELATQLKSLLLEIRNPATNTADITKVLWWLQQTTGGWVTTEIPGAVVAIQAPGPVLASGQVAGRKRVHEERAPWVEEETRQAAREVFGMKRNRAVMHEQLTRNTRQRLVGNVVLPLVPPTPG